MLPKELFGLEISRLQLEKDLYKIRFLWINKISPKTNKSFIKMLTLAGYNSLYLSNLLKFYEALKVNDLRDNKS